MVKCPNCGSTAQVKVLCADDLNQIWVGSLNVVYQHLYCGCGCVFARLFEFKEEIITTEEGDMRKEVIQ